MPTSSPAEANIRLSIREKGKRSIGDRDQRAGSMLIPLLEIAASFSSNGVHDRGRPALARRVANPEIINNSQGEGSYEIPSASLRRRAGMRA
jgi:hypothetical protein